MSKINDNSQETLNTWPFVYGHGEMEQDAGYDIFTFSDPMPEVEGFYAGFYNGNPVLIRITNGFRGLHGLMAYVKDTQSIIEITTEFDKFAG